MDKNKKVLLLGGAGFLGIGLHEELIQRGIDTISLDKSDVDLEQDKDKVSKILQKNLICSSDIVLLASKIGAKLFESDNSNDAAEANKKIFDNVLFAVQQAAKKRARPFSFVYYSSSELFGSQKTIYDLITTKTPYSFDFSKPRHKYSYVKWQAENQLFAISEQHPDVLTNVKIIRPFNICGKNQKRGVMFEMISNAINEGKIFYAADTVRTMTGIDTASKMAANAIMIDQNVKVNVADSRCSLTMKSLAKIINSVLGMNCSLIETTPDSYMRYRSVSNADADIKMATEVLTPHILALYSQIKNNE